MWLKDFSPASEEKRYGMSGSSRRTIRPTFSVLCKKSNHCEVDPSKHIGSLSELERTNWIVPVFEKDSAATLAVDWLQQQESGRVTLENERAERYQWRVREAL
jgi:hypothetical protein